MSNRSRCLTDIRDNLENMGNGLALLVEIAGSEHHYTPQVQAGIIAFGGQLLALHADVSARLHDLQDAFNDSNS